MSTREDREEMAQLSNPQTFPDKYKKLWVTNKRLVKQIDVMKMEITEKDRIIKQLKIEIDSTILEDTKNRLEFVRIVEEEVAEKTKQARQEYLNKIADMENQLEKEITLKFEFQRQLEFQKEQNGLLSKKIRELKDHIIVAMDQKDLIINELVKLVSNKDMQFQVQAMKREAAVRAQENSGKKINYSPVRNLGEQKIKPKIGGGTSKVYIKRNV